MPKQYTSRQIAAHFSQSYIDQSRDTEVISGFIKTLEGRVPKLRKSPDRQRYQDVSSLLYCVKDLRGSCRDAGTCAENGAKKDCGKNINRAANRLQEIGQLITEIRHNYPDEYEQSCKGLLNEWRALEFDKGEKFLQNAEIAERRSPGIEKTEDHGIMPASEPEKAVENKPAAPAAIGF